MNKPTPLFSIDAERSVLGSLLLKPELFEDVFEIVCADDFFKPGHKVIFYAICDLATAGEEIDVITAGEQLSKVGQLEYVGGVARLMDIIEQTPGTSNAISYAEIVKEHSRVRALAVAAGQISARTHEREGMTSEEMLEEAERVLSSLANNDQKAGEFESIGSILKGTVNSIDERFNSGESVTGIKTGLSDLDSITNGLQDSDLIILAGRPAMGKEQPNDSGVLLRDGTFKKMGEIQAGDKLASLDGQESIVQGVFPQGAKQTYTVTFSDGRKCEAGIDHFWEVMYRDWDAPRVWTTETLIKKLKCKRYQNRLYIERCSGDFGADEGVTIDPYLLGVLIGDGGLSTCSINLTNGDSHIINKISYMVGDLNVNRSSKIGYRLSATKGKGNWLIKELSKFGLMGHLSIGKFIPKNYLAASKETRIKLMQGLMDTDGGVGLSGDFEYSTSSPQLADDVISLARSLGCWVKVTSRYTYYTYNGEKRRGKLSYRIRIYHENLADFITLPRKRDRLNIRKTTRQKRVNFASIEPSRETECTCIMVSHPRSLYITDGYTMTHNTSLAVNLAENAAINEGKVVAVFSLEMPKKQLAERMISSIGRIDQNRIKTGKFEPDDFDRMMGAVKKLKDSKLFIDDTAGISPSYARSKLKKIEREHGSVDLVVIDYLQLMQIKGYKEGRTNEVSEISRDLKAIAKEFNCPVIALSQLNRSLETRPNKRPINSDLRESGSIEQDADIIMFVYRDEVYNEDSPYKGVAEIIIGKHRNGPIGTCRAAFIGKYTRFENLAASAYSEMDY